jgi:hypothetical protein
MAGPLRTAKDGAPQTCSPLDGARYRHHNLRCPYLLASDLRDWEEPRNTAALRQRTVRCEHPDCWGSYRRDAEGGSPFGCLECGTTDFTSGVHRDRCGRFRICTRCYTGLSGDLTGTSTEIRDLVFSRFEWWDTARPNPKAFRRDRPDRCDRCQKPGPVHAHHRDSDRRHGPPENREWLCDACHRAQPHDMTPYRTRNRRRSASQA